MGRHRVRGRGGDDGVVSDRWAAVERILHRAGLFDGAVAVAAISPATGPLTWAAGQLPDGTPLGVDTPLYAGSVTKQFTVALAARAVIAGALDVDTAVGAVLPGVARWASEVRVRHLIHHTAGLPSTARVVEALGLNSEADLDNGLVLDGLTRLDRPDSAAGRRFSYSNVGYVLLAEVVRVACGEQLAELGRRVIFEPLSMTGSHLGGPVEVALPGQPLPPGTVGDGGLWTTAGDLLRWLAALNNERLGEQLTRLVRTPGRLDDGTPLPYAWGVTCRPGPTGTSYTHGGDWHGWAAETVRDPEARSAIAVMTIGRDASVVSDATVAAHAHLAMP